MAEEAIYVGAQQFVMPTPLGGVRNVWVHGYYTGHGGVFLNVSDLQTDTDPALLDALGLPNTVVARVLLEGGERPLLLAGVNNEANSRFTHWLRARGASFSTRWSATRGGFTLWAMTRTGVDRTWEPQHLGRLFVTGFDWSANAELRGFIGQWAAAAIQLQGPQVRTPAARGH